jgi:Ca2+-binding EF-hand superfamily protein
MSTIGGIGSGYMAMQETSHTRAMRRPDPEAMASEAFAKIDTSGRGYIEKADLQSAMDSVRSAAGSTSGVSVDDLFAKLDGDGDGKVTKDEFSNGSKGIVDQMRQQYGDMRRLSGMGGMSGMPPAPLPGGGGAGFTKDELTSQLDSIGSSDDPRSALLSSIVDSFDAADTDGDGKVSFSEARTFAASSESDDAVSASSPSASSTSSTSTSSASSDLTASLTQQISRLLHAYGAAAASSDTSTLALSA